MKYLYFMSVAIVASFLSVYTYTALQSNDGVSAQSGLACEAVSGGSETCATQAGDPNADSILEQSINLLSVVAGVISVFMLMFGGFKYITSGGDAGKVASARNSIIYAIIGLVIVALAQVIVFFVISTGTPAPVTESVQGGVR